MLSQYIDKVVAFGISEIQTIGMHVYDLFLRIISHHPYESVIAGKYRAVYTTSKYPREILLKQASVTAFVVYKQQFGFFSFRDIDHQPGK